MLGLLDYNIRNTDLQWEVVKLQALPDDAVAVQLKQRIGVLPRKQGKYAQSFNSDPSYARLRRQGKQWKLYFFTSDAGEPLMGEVSRRPAMTTKRPGLELKGRPARRSR